MMQKKAKRERMRVQTQKIKRASTKKGGKKSHEEEILQGTNNSTYTDSVIKLVSLEENIVIGSTLENQNHHNIGFEHFNLERKAQTKAF